MKLLCFSDLHRDREAAAKLVAAASEVDCLIGAGDFATCRSGVADAIQVLAEVDKPAVLVPGNGESVEELREAAK
jgi:Icc-related predicted phosphoesterase